MSRHYFIIRIVTISEGGDLIAIDTPPITHARATRMLRRLNQSDVDALEVEAVRSDRIENPPSGITLVRDLNRMPPQIVRLVGDDGGA